MSPSEAPASLVKSSPSPIPAPAPAPGPGPIDAPRTDAPVVLSARELSVWYGTSLALKNVSIDIPRNRITALIGPSGCGKSTLLRCFNRMNDLISGFAMKGEIYFDGEPIHDELCAN